MMPPVPEIDLATARAWLDAGTATFLDVRDEASYQDARIPGARHLTDRNVALFIDHADKSRPVVVYCYHGHSSLGGTAYLLQHGFQQVASLAGGFEAWRLSFPCERKTPDGARHPDDRGGESA